MTLSGSSQNGQVADHCEPHSGHSLSNNTERRRGFRASCKSRTKRQEGLPQIRKCSMGRAPLWGGYCRSTYVASILLITSVVIRKGFPDDEEQANTFGGQG